MAASSPAEAPRLADRFIPLLRGNGPAPRGFGTAAVYWTTLSTILGAILFLRLGYAVAHVGLVGALSIIVIGHLVTGPTSMAVAEIATNQRVEGGGVYFMLSRSFGLVIGGAIGIALYLSQAISIAFYVIAFAQAFTPVLAWLGAQTGLGAIDTRAVSVPAMLAITWVMQARGAHLGLSILYVVVATLLASLALFFAGPSPLPLDFQAALATVKDPDPFFRVFAICFPAFTGLTAGVGLSGDLRNPKRAIPVGTLAAVATGLCVYVLVAFKLTASVPLSVLAEDPLAMSRVAVWGPIIPIGLAAATLSSALGSVLVAPRTLQALAADGAFPSPGAGRWLAATRARDQEPIHASLVTGAIALAFVLVGDVDFVAQIITMFFMVTYGAICLVSFFEHFASDPSYRPAFRSRWWLSLPCALLCLFLMFEISAGYAVLALVLLLLLHGVLRRYLSDVSSPVDLFQGAIFQVSRLLQLRVQRSRSRGEKVSWRPAAVCLSEATFRRTGALDLLRWISHRHGFATYIHYIQGHLSRSAYEEAQEVLGRVIRLVEGSEGNIYVDTIVSPSFTSAFSQLIQLPGISGKDNNLVVFEFDKTDPGPLEDAVQHIPMALATGFDVCVLGQAERAFGYRREIHLWIRPGDYENASLIVLLAYIIASHPDWRKAEIKMFEIVPEAEQEQRAEEMRELVRSGRLPISPRNIEAITSENGEDRRELMARRSRDADLVVMGFRRELLRGIGRQVFEGYDELGSVLFVCAQAEIEMERSSSPAGVEEGEPAADEDSAQPAAEGAEREGGA